MKLVCSVYSVPSVALILIFFAPQREQFSSWDQSAAWFSSIIKRTRKRLNTPGSSMSGSNTR